MYDMIMCMCVLFLNNGQIKTNSSSSSLLLSLTLLSSLLLSLKLLSSLLLSLKLLSSLLLSDSIIDRSIFTICKPKSVKQWVDN